jgi:HAD superfamily hydrolase (TIGR01509 family)
MTKWIVFDAMGVIFDEGDDIQNRLLPFLRRSNPSVNAEAVLSVYLKASLGQISSSGFWNKLGLGGMYPAVENEYLDTCLHLDPLVPETLRLLSAKFALAILSNDVKEWSDHLRRKYNLDRFFQTAVISGAVGIRKPALEIYRILLDRLGARGGDCIFVDDRLPNLPPAAALGMIPVWLAGENPSQVSDFPHRIKSLSEFPKLAMEIFPDAQNPFILDNHEVSRTCVTDPSAEKAASG